MNDTTAEPDPKKMIDTEEQNAYKRPLDHVCLKSEQDQDRISKKMFRTEEEKSLQQLDSAPVEQKQAQKQEQKQEQEQKQKQKQK